MSGMTRVKLEVVRELEVPADWIAAISFAKYCPTCLFVNPADVFSPRWIRAWLSPAAAHCNVHDRPLRKVSLKALAACSNFDSVIRMASLEESRLRYCAQAR